MNEQEEKRLRHLVREAVAPIDADAGPDADLWPAVLRRLDEQPVAESWVGWVRGGTSWVDWALLAGMAAVTVAFPASIPLLVYCF